MTEEGERPSFEGTSPVRERLHRAVAHQIGVAIVTGALQPGKSLDNEIDASEKLKVSRSAYREAMRLLTAKGLVVSRPKTGTQVNARRRWNMLDPEVLAWFFEAEKPDAAFLRDLFELRLVVEPQAAALAAVRRSPEDLSRMRKALMEMERIGVAHEAGRQADRAFHDAVLEATGNEPLISLASTVGAAVRWTTLFKQKTLASPRDPMPEHWRVFDCIAAGGADVAREAMRALVAPAGEDTREALGG